MTALDPYDAELRRHEHTLATIRATAEEMLLLTVKVFISGFSIDKHPNVRAARDPGATPSLLWNGDIAAEYPVDGLILLSDRRYPVTTLLEDQLRMAGWVRLVKIRGNEDAWIRRDRLATIVREWMASGVLR